MRVCAVVPCYKVSRQIVGVVSGLKDRVDHVFVVDDACPEQSGRVLLDALGEQNWLTLLYNVQNQGVGGAVKTGYLEAARQGYEIAIKVDGDGQMDPVHIPQLVAPILAGEADYTKGNRFFRPAYLHSMPRLRLLGNATLSFISKLSTGQWHIMDPTNGFTALHLGLLPWLPLDTIRQRFFFETDMLFTLGTIEAVVQDVPMPSRYGEEKSNLGIGASAWEFATGNLKLLGRRIFFRYFLRNFNLASVFLVMAIPSLLFGLFFGITAWSRSIESGTPATAGTIMVAALPVILGLQFLLGFLHYDLVDQPTKALWKRLGL